MNFYRNRSNIASSVVTWSATGSSPDTWECNWSRLPRSPGRITCTNIIPSIAASIVVQK